MKLFNLAAISLFSLWLQGCGQVEFMTSLKISSDFTNAEIEQITRAADAWCDASVACWDAEIVEPYHANIKKLTERPSDWPDARIGYTAQLIGRGGRVLGPLWVDILAGDDIECVAMHELGHVYGANGHTDEPGHVMSAVSTGCENGITEKDIKLVKSN